MTKFSKTMSRRSFFKWASSAGVGSALSGAWVKHARGQTAKQKMASADMKVPLRPFGRTKVDLPILSLGGIFNTGQNHVMMHQAVRWGVTYWDTATRYNRWGSEDGIGKYFARFPEHRKKIFLVTKSSTINPEYLDKELNTSLKNLQTEYVDLYFLHQVADVADELTHEIRRWVEKAKKQGRIRLFGFSVHSDMAHNLKLAAQLGWIDGIMTTYNYRLMVDDEMNRALDACHKAGIGLTAMKTQAVQMRRPRALGAETEAALKLTRHFMDKGYTVHQARLMAVWSDPRITSICSQMENITILKENVTAAVSDQKLARHELDRFIEYDSATASTYCAGCTRICESHQPHAAPIGKIMRYLMYARSYGDLDRARRKFGRLPPSVRKTMATADYTTAEVRCPRNMAIGRLMKSAVRELG